MVHHPLKCRAKPEPIAPGNATLAASRPNILPATGADTRVYLIRHRLLRATVELAAVATELRVAIVRQGVSLHL